MTCVAAGGGDYQTMRLIASVVICAGALQALKLKRARFKACSKPGGQANRNLQCLSNHVKNFNISSTAQYIFNTSLIVGGEVKSGNSLENLHAMVVGVSHHDAPVAVDGNAAKRSSQLSVACAEAADGANMGAVDVA